MPDAIPKTEVPEALKTWFILHFLVDLLFAIPLMVVPVRMLALFGWQTVDPYTARLTAAALFGIGIDSFLGRNASLETYRNMLTLKIIWSSAAVIGIIISLAQRAQGNPIIVWGVLALFAGFNGLWVYWRRQIR